MTSWFLSLRPLSLHSHFQDLRKSGSGVGCGLRLLGSVWLWATDSAIQLTTLQDLAGRREQRACGTGWYSAELRREPFFSTVFDASVSDVGSGSLVGPGPYCNRLPLILHISGWSGRNLGKLPRGGRGEVASPGKKSQVVPLFIFVRSDSNNRFGTTVSFLGYTKLSVYRTNVTCFTDL